MLSTLPTISEIDATVNLLAILELAKDATALKASLETFRQAIEESDKKLADIAEAIAASATAEQKAEAVASRAQAKIDKADQDIGRVAAAFAQLEIDRAAAKAARDEVDAYAHVTREELAQAQAKVASDNDQLDKARIVLDEREAAIGAEMQKAIDAQAAAEALRSEYESKIAALKSLTA